MTANFSTMIQLSDKEFLFTLCLSLCLSLSVSVSLSVRLFLCLSVSVSLSLFPQYKTKTNNNPQITTTTTTRNPETKLTASFQKIGCRRTQGSTKESKQASKKEKQIPARSVDHADSFSQILIEVFFGESSLQTLTTGILCNLWKRQRHDHIV